MANRTLEKISFLGEKALPKMPLRSGLEKRYINTILQEIPALSSLFSAYASIITTIMLLCTMFDQFLPPQVRSYVIDTLKYYWKPKSSHTTLVFEEYDGRSPNEMFNVAEAYLCTIISQDSNSLRITKRVKESHFNIKFAESQEIVDLFEGISVTWKYVTEQPKKGGGDSSQRRIILKSDQIHKDVVLTRYLPSIIKKVKDLENQKKAVNIFSLHPERTRCFKDGVNLDHPSTFDTLAMDPNQKKAIIDDLDLFVRRRAFYKKIGKAWKRGYLLYGPPGTGKSSLIAAMANYLKFDVYDLQLMNVRSDSVLKDMMLQTSNRSILVIEDIDCGMEIPDRNGTTTSKSKSKSRGDSKFSLSGLLNFIDGLWSCCGDERIIIFTTNHLEKLDPALLRPGRMDMHIHMSYLTFNGFKTLAANYLNINNDHWRFREIEELIRSNKVTPAEVAEELLKSDNAEVVLEGLVKFLEGKKNGVGATTTKGINDKGDEVLEAKTNNMYKSRSKTHVD